jgi:hypothetical protein
MPPTSRSRQRIAPKARRPRRSLSQRGGAIRAAGDPEMASRLAKAIAGTDGAPADDLTHGFHTYPARMHPALARTVIGGLTRPGDIVVDPFCGGGTVLVEALVAGCRSLGIDLNPLALRIAEVRCALRDAGARAQFETSLRRVGAASAERARGRIRPRFSLDRSERVYYEPHALLELAGLFDEIRAVAAEADRRALMIVFSALLVKFSRQRADTSDELIEKRIRRGQISDFFVRKGQELAQRWQALFESAPKRAFPTELRCGDARRLRSLIGEKVRADLIVTSPPYGGTYDYAHQHARRNAWFGLDAATWEAREIGARRRLSRGEGVEQRWDEEMLAALRAMRSVLRDTGHLVLWLGDAELAGRRIAAHDQLARLSPKAGFELLASASQERRDARSGPPRGEHLLLLEPMAPSKGRRPASRP